MRVKRLILIPAATFEPGMKHQMKQQHPNQNAFSIKIYWRTFLGKGNKLPSPRKDDEQNQNSIFQKCQGRINRIQTDEVVVPRSLTCFPSSRRRSNVVLEGISIVKSDDGKAISRLINVPLLLQRFICPNWSQQLSEKKLMYIRPV